MARGAGAGLQLGRMPGKNMPREKYKGRHREVEVPAGKPGGTMMNRVGLGSTLVWWKE